MWRWFAVICLLFTVALSIVGCGGGNVPQRKTVEVPMPSGLERAKMLLQNYAEGQPLGSEVSTFPQILEEVRKSAPDKAAILEKGFTDLQSQPAKSQQIARDLLRQL